MEIERVWPVVHDEGAKNVPAFILETSTIISLHRHYSDVPASYI